MKIAFVIPAYYPAIIGESLYAQEISRYLVDKGHEVRVITHINPGWAPREKKDGVDIVRVQIKTIMGGKFYFSSSYVKSVMTEKYDVIHSHHYGYFPATAGFIAAKLTNTPHFFGPYYHPPIYGMKRWAMFLAYHATQGLPILRFSDSVLPHTKYEKKMLLKIGAKEDNMDILPNIVDTKDFIPSFSKEKIVLFVSNLIYEKGAHVAFDIAEKILEEKKDVKFVFIGNVREPRLVPRIEKLRKNKKFIFLSNVSKKDLIRWYQRASVVVLPSMYEAFSRVLAEAQACGTPVVSTKVGAIPEVILDGKSGYLVNYGDWEKMKEHIIDLVENTKTTKKMGKIGAENIKRKFDTKIVVGKLEKLYEKFSG